MLPVVPVIAAAALAGTENVWRTYAAARAAATGAVPPAFIGPCVATLLVGSFTLGPAFVLKDFIRLRDVYPYHVMNSGTCWQAGLQLRRDYPSDTQVVAFRIGAVGRASGMIVDDLYGLVDREIAEIIEHAPGYYPDSRYGDDLPALRLLLAARRPRLILIHNRGDNPPPYARFYGFEYAWRRAFWLGRNETWELYEREN